jgi:uncharacterized protein (TIGR03067 family)
VAKQLPARPHLDHLRSQAKTLLASLKAGDGSAVRTFIAHLPAAHGLSSAKVRAAGFRLADAQSVVARRAGFDSWPALSRHVEHLRALEGHWHVVGLQIDGAEMPAATFARARLLMDGDRFRMESPEGNYDGTFTIDTSVEPMRIDIDFVEGPDAGNSSHGIFELDGDQLTICLGLVGASRPVGFSTSPGSGHALQRLRRASPRRPAGVTGGTPPPAAPATDFETELTADAASFDVEMTPLLQRLEGEWSAVAIVRDGQEMPTDWLSFGSRTATGNEVKVVFGGQVMVHAKVRIDERATPAAVDYLNLSGSQKGKLSLGIMDWVGDDARFLMAVPGKPRPTSFAIAPGKGQTLSRWRRKSHG